MKELLTIAIHQNKFVRSVACYRTADLLKNGSRKYNNVTLSTMNRLDRIAKESKLSIRSNGDGTSIFIRKH